MQTINLQIEDTIYESIKKNGKTKPLSELLNEV